MVEGLHQEVVKKVEKLSSKMGDGGGGGGGVSNPLLMPKLDDILKWVKRLENLNSAFADNDIKMIATLKSIEKNQKAEVIPSLQVLTAGGIGGGSGGGGGGGGGEGRVSDFRMTALTVKLSEIQPKLDDLYIRVLPTLEEIKSRQRKEEDMERLEER